MLCAPNAPGMQAKNQRSPFGHQHARHLAQSGVRLPTALQGVGQHQQIQTGFGKRQRLGVAQQLDTIGQICGHGIKVLASAVFTGQIGLLGGHPAPGHAVTAQSLQSGPAQLQAVVPKNIGHRLIAALLLPLQRTLLPSQAPRRWPCAALTLEKTAHESGCTPACVFRQLHLAGAQRSACPWWWTLAMPAPVQAALAAIAIAAASHSIDPPPPRSHGWRGRAAPNPRLPSVRPHWAKRCPSPSRASMPTPPSRCWASPGRCCRCPGTPLATSPGTAPPWAHSPRCSAAIRCFLAGAGGCLRARPSKCAASLQQLAALPADTQVFCAHEYTLSDLSLCPGR